MRPTLTAADDGDPRRTARRDQAWWVRLAGGEKTVTAPVSRLCRTVLAAVSAALLVMMSALPATATSQGGSPVTADEAERSVERAKGVLGEQLAASGIPGGAVAVVSGGSVEARGVGDAGHGQTVTAATPFVIGSASKSFTALAVMQLVDSGAVALDDPVRQYVPELELAPGEPVDSITVRHLLNHTSGLDDLSGGPLLASAADGTPEDAVAELNGAGLVFSPGERWLYANVNFVLAGLVVERVSGLTYGDYVQRRIFEPLEMTHSYVAAAPAVADGLSSGHQFWFGFPVATDPTQRQATLAAGYLISSAEDLARYLAMYLNGGLAADGTRIVSAEALQTMLAPAVDAHLGPWADGQASQYAMGWFRGGPWGEDMIFHPGNTPDTSTLLLLSPSQGVAVATVVNASNELPVPGNPFIADRVTRNVTHAALDQPPVELPSLQRFYLLLDLAVIIPLGLALWGLLRAARAVGGPRPARRGWGWLGVATRSVAAAALVGLLLTTTGLASAWTWTPDIALAIAALALLLALTAVLRLLPLMRARNDAHHPTVEPPARERLPFRQGALT